MGVVECGLCPEGCAVDDGGVAGLELPRPGEDDRGVAESEGLDRCLGKKSGPRDLVLCLEIGPGRWPPGIWPKDKRLAQQAEPTLTFALLETNTG